MFMHVIATGHYPWKDITFKKRHFKIILTVAGSLSLALAAISEMDLKRMRFNSAPEFVEAFFAFLTGKYRKKLRAIYKDAFFNTTVSLLPVSSAVPSSMAAESRGAKVRIQRQVNLPLGKDQGCEKIEPVYLSAVDENKKEGNAIDTGDGDGDDDDEGEGAVALAEEEKLEEENNQQNERVVDERESMRDVSWRNVYQNKTLTPNVKKQARNDSDCSDSDVVSPNRHLIFFKDDTDDDAYIEYAIERNQERASRKMSKSSSRSSGRRRSRSGSRSRKRRRRRREGSNYKFMNRTSNSAFMKSLYKDEEDDTIEDRSDGIDSGIDSGGSNDSLLDNAGDEWMYNYMDEEDSDAGNDAMMSASALVSSSTAVDSIGKALPGSPSAGDYFLEKLLARAQAKQVEHEGMQHKSKNATDASMGSDYASSDNDDEEFSVSTERHNLNGGDTEDGGRRDTGSDAFAAFICDAHNLDASNVRKRYKEKEGTDRDVDSGDDDAEAHRRMHKRGRISQIEQIEKFPGLPSPYQSKQGRQRKHRSNYNYRKGDVVQGYADSGTSTDVQIHANIGRGRRFSRYHKHSPASSSPFNRYSHFDRYTDKNNNYQALSIPRDYFYSSRRYSPSSSHFTGSDSYVRQNNRNNNSRVKSIDTFGASHGKGGRGGSGKSGEKDSSLRDGWDRQYANTCNVNEGYNRSIRANNRRQDYVLRRRHL